MPYAAASRIDDYFILSFCHLVILSFCHPAIMPGANHDDKFAGEVSAGAGSGAAAVMGLVTGGA
jgi:hypothetical protein